MEWTVGNPGQPICVGEIDVPTGDFEILQREAPDRDDEGFSKLLQIGYEAMVNAYPVFELENAAAANNALMQLLVENMEFRRKDSGASSFEGGGESEKLCYGVFQLAQQCQERLTKSMGVALGAPPNQSRGWRLPLRMNAPWRLPGRWPAGRQRQTTTAGTR